jgi:hypothetical protein
MSYAVKANVAIITGKSASEVDDFFLGVADRAVERILNRSFGSTAEVTEYFDTKRRNAFFDSDIGSRDFPLTNWPVTAVSTVQIIYRNKDSNNVVTETTTTLTADNGYYLENLDRGCIIKLSNDIDPPIGHKTIKIVYTWGYASVPQEIKDFADYYASALCETGVSLPKNASGNILSELEMGRYREKYANPNTVFNTKYGAPIKDMIESLVARYKLWE